MVEMLLQDSRVDPSAEDNQALIAACEGRNVEVVKLLLGDPRVDPSDAIRFAIADGHLEVVKLLLADSRVDPNDNLADAILCAEMEDHIEVVTLVQNAIYENERRKSLMNRN
jgi:hypothetical protein